MKWCKIISVLMFLCCVACSSGGVRAESGVYDYSGDFLEQVEQNPLDRDYKMDFVAANTTIAYGELEAKYIKLWDRELNLIYQKLMKKLNNQQIDILIDSQVGWLQWHTQETKFVGAVWNNERKLGSQGSIQELKAQKQRLRNRTLELMEYYYLFARSVEFEYQGK